jgi:hypothetical protein
VAAGVPPTPGSAGTMTMMLPRYSTRRCRHRPRRGAFACAPSVKASGTSLTEIFGVGPVLATTVIGSIGQVSRFTSQDCFAACNGTAPAGVSSGNWRIHRLSRRVNHAIHMAAVIRNNHSDGCAYFDRKLAEGKTRTEALHCLKRRVSDAIYACLRDDARCTRCGGLLTIRNTLSPQVLRNAGPGVGEPIRQLQAGRSRWLRVRGGLCRRAGIVAVTIFVRPLITDTMSSRTWLT